MKRKASKSKSLPAQKFFKDKYYQMVPSIHNSSDLESNSSSDTDPEYLPAGMFKKKPKKRFKTNKVPKKYRWISPGYINFKEAVTFEKIEKETVLKLPEIIPQDKLKDKYINEFYIMSRRKPPKGGIMTFREG